MTGETSRPELKSSLASIRTDCTDYEHIEEFVEVLCEFCQGLATITLSANHDFVLRSRPITTRGRVTYLWSPRDDGGVHFFVVCATCFVVRACWGYEMDVRAAIHWLTMDA